MTQTRAYHGAAKMRWQLSFLALTCALLACNDVVVPGPVSAVNDVASLSGHLVVSRLNPSSNGYELYITNADGSNERQLTNAGSSGEGALFPDGKHIVFESNRDEAYGDLYVMDTSGSNIVRLTTDSGVQDEFPRVTPNGQSIAFISYHPNALNSEIEIMRADGSNRRTVYSGDWLSFVSWSANGHELAFGDYNTKQTREVIGVIQNTGSNYRTRSGVIDGVYYDWPQWSPIAPNRLVFTKWSKPNGWQLCIKNAFGGRDTVLVATGNSISVRRRGRRTRPTLHSLRSSMRIRLACTSSPPMARVSPVSPTAGGKNPLFPGVIDANAKTAGAECSGRFHVADWLAARIRSYPG